MKPSEELQALYARRKLGEVEALLRREPSLLKETLALFSEGDGDAVTALLQVVGRVGFDYPDEALPLSEGIVALMGDDDPFVRMDAAQAFATLFAQNRSCAVKGMPVLHGLLDDESSLVRGDAAQAIGNIGFYFPDLVEEEARRLLFILDTGDDDDEREAVAHSLGKIGATNPELLKEIFPRLVRALEKTREASCGGILLAFGTVGLHYPELVKKYIPKLMDYLQSENEDTVRYAVLAIGNIASSNPELVKDAVPLLERVAKMSDPDLRVNARMALSMLKPGS
jgi:HEAT repeat protein